MRYTYAILLNIAPDRPLTQNYRAGDALQLVGTGRAYLTYEPENPELAVADVVWDLDGETAEREGRDPMGVGDVLVVACQERPPAYEGVISRLLAGWQAERWPTNVVTEGESFGEVALASRLTGLVFSRPAPGTPREA